MLASKIRMVGASRIDRDVVAGVYQVATVVAWIELPYGDDRVRAVSAERGPRPSRGGCSGVAEEEVGLNGG
jgi:hypothetical protein